MLGIGNPLLDGDPVERPWGAKGAQLARNKQACPHSLAQRVAGVVEIRRSVQKVATRSGHADLDHLRSSPMVPSSLRPSIGRASASWRKIKTGTLAGGEQGAMAAVRAAGVTPGEMQQSRAGESEKSHRGF
jgi:hypothetical protein